MRSELMKLEAGSKLNLLLSRASRLEVESNLSHMRGDQVDLTHKLEKARAERQVFTEDFRRTALQDRVNALAKRNSAAEDLKKAELRQHMVVLTTPVDAVVLEIAHRSIGSVLREVETLPRDAPLQAEVNVDSRDIGEVAVGQPVRIKFEAFPFKNTARLPTRCVSSARTRSRLSPGSMRRVVGRERRRLVFHTRTIECSLI
jgi:HlyD family secretion protein